MPNSLPEPTLSHERADGTVSPAAEGTGSPATLPSDHPNAPHPVAAGLQRIGAYTVIKMIGEGGMGAVYLAEDTRLGRKVAIKTMKPELAANKSDRDRFEREARAAAKLEHDNIVPVWGVDEADGAPFIVMPHLQGETLDARLIRAPSAGIGLVLKVAKEVADGLAAAHAKGLIHRDIKPGNIWLEGDPSARDLAQQVRRCKILDFGLARSVDKEDAQITASGAILGTPAYMAPEQARGEKVDARADLFSLGVTLYRTATGKSPFGGPTPMAVLIALTTEPPRPVLELNPNVPSALADLITRLMSKDPSGRPLSAVEVGATVRQIIKDWRAKKTEPQPEAPTGALPVRVLPLPDVRDADPVSGSTPRLVLVSDEDTDHDPHPPRKPPKDEPRRSLAPWLIGAAVGVLALVPLGWWLATRGDKPDPNTAMLKESKDDPKAKDGGPKPVEEKKPLIPNADPDRTAVNYVRSIGGCVYVNDDEKVIKADEELPKGPLRLNNVQFLSERHPTDEGVAAFAGCRNMNMLGLSGAPVGDAGLAHFRENKGLKYVYLQGTRITSEGLSALKDCTGLLELNLSGTNVGNEVVPKLKQYPELYLLMLKGSKVSSEGLAELGRALPRCEIEHDGGTVFRATEADRKAAERVLALGGKVQIDSLTKDISDASDLPKGLFRLTGVDLSHKEKVTDAALAAFADCANLKELNLSNTSVGGEGLAHFKNCKNLETLKLSATKANDAGLAHFGSCENLARLDIGSVVGADSPISDAGLTHFQNCKNFKALHVRAGTKITQKGATDFAKSHPECRVEWDGKVIQP